MPQQEEVRLYTLSTCSHCKAAKRFLDEWGIAYSYTDVDLYSGEQRKAILDDVMKYNPACSFPTILIGDKVIVGFREDEIRRALNI